MMEKYLTILDSVSSAYLAGFFDADGSVGIYQRGKGGYQVNVTIANSGKHGRDICNTLVKMFGGSVTSSKRKKDTHRDAFWFKLNGKEVVEKFLMYIYNDVYIKKDQVRISLEFLQVVSHLPRYRSEQQKQLLETYVRRCKEMKRAC